MFGNKEAVFTEAILTGLHALEEAPWKDLNGKGLDSRGLSLRLRQYGIKSKQIRRDPPARKATSGPISRTHGTAISRHLQTSETSETAETIQHFQGAVSDVSDSSPPFRMRPRMFRIATTASLNGGPKSQMKSTSVSDVSDVSLLADAAFSEVGPSDVSDVPDPGWRNNQVDDITADQTCAQCNGAIDGTERMVSVSGHTVWLHEACERFWRGFVARER